MSQKTLDLSPSSINELSCCTRLQSLSIDTGRSLDLNVLAPLTALTFLQLKNVDRAHCQLSSISLARPAAAGAQAHRGPLSLPEGSTSILAVLQNMQQLRTLLLSPGLLPEPFPPLEQYSALTASSHLTVLSLYHSHMPPGG